MGTIGESASGSSASMVEKRLDDGCLGLRGLRAVPQGRGVSFFLDVDATGLRNFDLMVPFGALPSWEAAYNRREH